MDDQHFDDLIRGLGSGLSRRGALRSALGGLVAAVAGVSALSVAAAKPGKGKGKTQGKNKHKSKQRAQVQCSSGDCSTCRTLGQSCNPQYDASHQCCATQDLRCSVRTGEGTCIENTPVCQPNCTDKRCGDADGCGSVCGGCPERQLCVVGREDVTCKAPPVCAPNGGPGICCSGYHRDGICCDPNDPGAVAITVQIDVFNSITVTTPPNSVIVTLTSPPAPAAPIIGGAGRRKRRRRRRKGGRR
jgi:hypothetical protein